MQCHDMGGRMVSLNDQCHDWVATVNGVPFLRL